MYKDEKMIDEMARVLCNRKCEECVLIPGVPCGYKSYCVRLYKAGCRIIADDEIVIKKSDYEILKDISSLKDKVQEALNINPIEELIQVERNARQETAREILLQVEHDFVENPVLSIFEILDRIADRYGLNWDGIHNHNI